ncbi:hypothetical protein HNQ92_002824 [Rhabdobacter roseus]|uniref:Uncharacterized protein n=1 Tax=Rhabdobacter roseus TaxID=1655419 RepID=A0A840TM57_9BACT|nr:hypothetical protein [Rhabdobacter roseus]
METRKGTFPPAAAQPARYILSQKKYPPQREVPGDFVHS